MVKTLVAEIKIISKGEQRIKWDFKHLVKDSFTVEKTIEGFKIYTK